MLKQIGSRYETSIENNSVQDGSMTARLKVLQQFVDVIVDVVRCIQLKNVTATLRLVSTLGLSHH